MEEKQKQLSFEINPEVAKGIYSNLAIIAHSEHEIILDFASMLPGAPKAQVCSRIIMTPLNAKRLLAALQDNLSKYDQQFGAGNQGAFPYALTSKGDA